MIDAAAIAGGPAGRQRALELAERIEADRPDEAERIRRLVAEQSTAAEVRARIQERLARAEGAPTPAEIAERAAAVRRGWTDSRGILQVPPEGWEKIGRKVQTGKIARMRTRRCKDG